MTSLTMTTQAEGVAEFWLNQQQIVDDRLSPILRSSDSVVYLDYPIHSNVGDLLIYLGTEAWFERQSTPVVARWNMHQFPFPPLAKKTTILLHGGGNFGDLYAHQGFREKVIAHYRQNRIVFLPQTIWYRSASRLEQSKCALNHHSDLHLLLRDTRSLEFARTNFPSARCALCPDMSVNLFPISETMRIDLALSVRHRPMHSVCLKRSDREWRTEERFDVDECDWSGDWRQLLGARLYQIRAWQVAARVLPERLAGQSFTRRWQNFARHIASLSARHFASSERVVTSRLHGHILASLVGTPNVLFDNVYGKNLDYWQTWHKPLTEYGLTSLAGENPRE